MKIPVLGMDPSLRNWGMAFSHLDLETGVLDTPDLSLIKTAEEPKGKQVRQNSYDIEAAEELASGVMPLAQQAKVIFVEVPVGSQSAAAMKGYGVCIGILGAIRAAGIPIIEVSEAESKKVMTTRRTATKDEMIQAGMAWYPNANWPMQRGNVTAGRAEHMADAIAAIHAGVLTQQFQNLMRLFQAV